MKTNRALRLTSGKNHIVHRSRIIPQPNGKTISSMMIKVATCSVKGQYLTVEGKVGWEKTLTTSNCWRTAVLKAFSAVFIVPTVRMFM